MLIDQFATKIGCKNTLQKWNRLWNRWLSVWLIQLSKPIKYGINECLLWNNVDSTCVLIGLQVRCHSATKNENDVSNVVDCLRVVRIYSTRVLHISSFSLLRLKNDNFIKEIKPVVCVSIACWKPRKSLWEFSSRWKHSIVSLVFTDLLSNSPKRSPRFSSGYKGTENLFYFLRIIDTIKSLTKTHNIGD